MSKSIHLSPCNLAEVFSRLEKADDFTFQSIWIELACMRKERERREHGESTEARRAKGQFGRIVRLGK